jgi:hypothetical protein
VDAGQVERHPARRGDRVLDILRRFVLRGRLDRERGRVEHDLDLQAVGVRRVHAHRVLRPGLHDDGSAEVCHVQADSLADRDLGVGLLAGDERGEYGNGGEHRFSFS